MDWFLCDRDSVMNELTNLIHSETCFMKKSKSTIEPASFYESGFQKEAYIKSNLRNKYWRVQSTENKAAYKKQRNTSVKISSENIKNCTNKFQD